MTVNKLVKLICYVVIFITSLMFAIIAGCGELTEHWNNQRIERDKKEASTALDKADYALQVSSINAQIKINEARAIAESAFIINEALKNKENYLKYLWLTTISQRSHDTIYIQGDMKEFLKLSKTPTQLKCMYNSYICNSLKEAYYAAAGY